MQHERFHDDPTLTRTAARVVRHDDGGLVLDATMFYPLGGGQSGDTGTLLHGDGRSLPILDTRRDRTTREILHLLPDDTPRLAPGAEVEVELDWTRRHRHMRMHTALHLLSAEIGAVRVAKIESKGARNRRVALAFVED